MKIEDVFDAIVCPEHAHAMLNLSSDMPQLFCNLVRVGTDVIMLDSLENRGFSDPNDNPPPYSTWMTTLFRRSPKDHYNTLVIRVPGYEQGLLEVVSFFTGRGFLVEEVDSINSYRLPTGRIALRIFVPERLFKLAQTTREARAGQGFPQQGETMTADKQLYRGMSVADLQLAFSAMDDASHRCAIAHIIRDEHPESIKSFAANIRNSFARPELSKGVLRSLDILEA